MLSGFPSTKTATNLNCHMSGSYFVIVLKLVVWVEIRVSRQSVGRPADATHHGSDQYEGHASARTPGNSGMWGGYDTNLNRQYFFFFSPSDPHDNHMTIFVAFHGHWNWLWCWFSELTRKGDDYILSLPGKLLVGTQDCKRMAILHNGNNWCRNVKVVYGQMVKGRLWPIFCSHHTEWVWPESPRVHQRKDTSAFAAVRFVQPVYIPQKSTPKAPSTSLSPHCHWPCTETCVCFSKLDHHKNLFCTAQRHM